MSDEAEDLARRLSEYRRMKEAAAWLRRRLEDQPFRPGAKRKPGRPEDPQLRLPT